MEHLDCSCVDCTYGGSPKKSLKKLIALGDRFDELYLGKFLPLRERKLLEKLIRTRAAYYEIRADLLASGTDFSVDSKIQNLSNKKASKAVENVNKRKSRVIKSNCCSCCTIMCDPKSIDLTKPPKVHINCPPPEVIEKLVEKYPPKVRKKPRRVDKKEVEKMSLLHIERHKSGNIIRSSSEVSKKQKLENQELQGKTQMEKVILKTSSQGTTMSKRYLKEQETKRKRQAREFMRSTSQGSMIHKHKIGQMSEHHLKEQEIKRKKQVGRSISQGTMIHLHKLGEMSERRRKEQEMERKKQLGRSISQGTVIHKHQSEDMSEHRRKEQEMERKGQAGKFTRSTSQGLMVAKQGKLVKDKKIKDTATVGHKYKMTSRTSQAVRESKSFASQLLDKAAYRKDKIKSQQVTLTETQILKQKIKKKVKKSTERISGSRRRKQQIKKEKDKRFRDVKDSVLKIKERVDEENVDSWPCELGVCVPDECDPQTCLKRIHKQMKAKGEHFKHSLDGVNLKKKIVSLKEKLEVNKESDGDIRFACELGICVPDKCEPERCLQRMKEGLGKGDHIMHSLSSKISTSSKNLKINILNKNNIDKFACEPGICVPDKCKPEECLKKMKIRKAGLVKKTLTKITFISRRKQKRDKKKLSKKTESIKKQPKANLKVVKQTSKLVGSQPSGTQQLKHDKSKSKEKVIKKKRGGFIATNNGLVTIKIGKFKFHFVLCNIGLESDPTVKKVMSQTSKQNADTLKSNQKKGKGVAVGTKKSEKSLQKNNKMVAAATKSKKKVIKKDEKGIILAKRDRKNVYDKKGPANIETSKSSEAMKIISSKSVPNIKKIKDRKGKLSQYECEPGICIPDECDPMECLKYIKLRNKNAYKTEHSKSTEILAKSTSGIQTKKYQADHNIQHKIKGHKHAYECDPRICKNIEQHKKHKVSKKFVTPNTHSSGSETMTIYTDIAVQKRTKNKKRRRYECEPGICDSETCDPLTCIKAAKKRLKKKSTESAKTTSSRFQTKNIDKNKMTQHEVSKVVSQIPKPTKVYHKKPNNFKYTSSSSQTVKKYKKSLKYPGHVKSIHSQISIKLPKIRSKPKVVNDVEPKLKTIRKTEDKYVHVKEEKKRSKNIAERDEHSKSLHQKKKSAITIMPKQVKSNTTGCHRQAVRLGSSCSFSIEFYKERCDNKNQRQSFTPPLTLREHSFNPNEYEKPVEVLHRRKHNHRHHKHTESQNNMTLLRPEMKTEQSTINAGFKTRKNQIKTKQYSSDIKQQTDRMNTIKQQTGKINVPGVKLQTHKINVPGVKLQTENVIEKVPGVKVQTEKITGTKQQTEGIIEKVPGIKQQTDTSSFENVTRSVGVTAKRKHHKTKEMTHNKKVQSNIKLSPVTKSSSNLKTKKNKKEQLITTTESSVQANIAKLQKISSTAVDTDRQDDHHKNTKLPDSTYACEKETCVENECDPRECYEKIKMKHIKENEKYKYITANNKLVNPKQIFTTVSRPPSGTRQAVRIGSKCSFDIEFYKDRLQSGDTGHKIKRYYSDSNKIVTTYPKHKHRKSRNTRNFSTAGHMLRRCFCTLHMQKKHKHRHSHRFTVNFLTIPNSFVYSIKNYSATASHQLNSASTKSDQILSFDSVPLENAISCITITDSMTCNKSKIIQKNLQINNVSSETRPQQCSFDFGNMMSPESSCPINCPPKSDDIVIKQKLNITTDKYLKEQINRTYKRFQKLKNCFRSHFITNPKNAPKHVTESFKIKTMNPTASSLQTYPITQHIKKFRLLKLFSQIHVVTCSLMTLRKSNVNNETIKNLKQTCNKCDVKKRSYKRCHSPSNKPSLSSKLKKYLNVFKFNTLSKNHKKSKDKNKSVKSKNSTGLLPERENVHSNETHSHFEQISENINLNTPKFFNEIQRFRSYSNTLIFENKNFYCSVVADFKRDYNYLEEITNNDLKYALPSINTHDLNDINNYYDVKRIKSILIHHNDSVTKTKLEEKKIPAQIIINKALSSSTSNLYNNTQNSLFHSGIRLSALEMKISNYCGFKRSKDVPSSKKQTTRSQTEDDKKHNLKTIKSFQFLVEAFDRQDPILQVNKVKSNCNEITTTFAQFPSNYDFNLDELYGKNSIILGIDQERRQKKSEILFPELVSKSLTGISKYLKRSYFTMNLEEKRTRSHRHAKRECEPNVCVVGECYPNDCLRRINKRDAKYNDRGAGGNKDSIARSLIKQRGRKRRPMEHEHDMPDEYIVEEPRTLKNIVQTFAPRRQAVKIGSTFSFNIEFYKEKKDGICFSQPSQVVRKPVQRPPPPVKIKKQVQPRKQRSVSTFTADVRDYRDVGTVGEPYVKQHREAQIGHRYKETAIGPKEKCYCTAKLQTKGKKRGTTSTTTMAVREHKTTGAGEIKYACDKGLCTSGLCDPKKCMEKKLGTKPVTTSIASVTLRPQRDTGAGVRVQKRIEKGVKVKPPKRRHQETKIIVTEPEPSYKSVGIQKKPRPVKRYVQRYGQPLQIEAPESSDECNRQAVKIGSSFDFNVEFFKDKCDSSDKHVRYAEPGYSDNERQQAEVKPARHKIKATMTNPLKRCFCTLKLQKQGNDSRDTSNSQKRGRTPSTAAYFCKCKYGLSYTHVTDPYKNTRQIKKKRYLATTTHHSEINFSPDSVSLSSHKSGLGDVSYGYRYVINCDPLSCFDFSETSSSHSIVTILPYRAKRHKNRSKSTSVKPKTKKLVRNQRTSVEQVNPKTVTINVSYLSKNGEERYNHPYMTIAYDNTNIEIYSKYTRPYHLKRHKISRSRHNISE